MREKLIELEKHAFQELESIEDPGSLENFRVKYLGKKGLIHSAMKALRDLPAKERPEAGQIANRVKDQISNRFEQKRVNLGAKGVQRPFFLDVCGRLFPALSRAKSIWA